MKTEEMESNVTRLAALIGSGDRPSSDAEVAEAVGLAVGIVGAVAIAVIKGAESLAQIATDAGRIAESLKSLAAQHGAA